jgi:hypothetical protein
MQKKWLPIGIILIVLITALVILVTQHKQSVDLTADFRISFDGEIYSLSDYQLTSIEQLDINVFGEEKFRGYPLSRMISAVGILWDDLKEIYLNSEDGSRLRVDPEEVIQTNVILVPIQENPLRFRVIFPLDEFRYRWLKDIYLLELH